MGLGVGEDALHLIEDHALEDEFGVGVAQIFLLQAPTFLSRKERVVKTIFRHGFDFNQPEILLLEFGSKDGVAVNVHEVVVVLGIGRGEGVERVVRPGHGIHESGERAVQHLEERISNRVALGAAQGHVFQDVTNPRRVKGHRLETHGEGVDLVVGLK